MIYNAQRRDGNEKEIIDALRAAGVYVDQMPVGSGFDLLCAHVRVLAVMEVKPVGVWKLTEAEQEVADSLRAQGVIYYVVHDPIEALDIFGLVDAPSPTGVSI